MEQSRMLSFIEACIHTSTGFVLSFIIWPLCAFLFEGIDYHVGSHFGVVGVFTVASVLRGYAIRHWCQAYLHRIALRVDAFILTFRRTWKRRLSKWFWSF